MSQIETEVVPEDGFNDPDAVYVAACRINGLTDNGIDYINIEQLLTFLRTTHDLNKNSEPDVLLILDMIINVLEGEHL